MKKNLKDKFDPFESNQLFSYSTYLNNFITLYKKGNLPKVLMLSGEKGLGKFTLAFHLFHFINTERDKEYRYNLDKQIFINNVSFISSLKSNTCENFYYLGNNHEVSVSINDVREIKKKLTNRPLNGFPRIIVFDDADLFNKNSANSLLKIIEEPTEFNYFILINNQRNYILDTLKSRSIEFKIFLKKNEKKIILSNLLKKNNINLSLDENIIYNLTPGILLRIHDTLIDYKIDLSNDYLSNIEILLDVYKKNKQYIFIDIIKLILDIKLYLNTTKKNSNYFYLNEFKIKTNKLLSQFEKFNLSKNSILDNLQSL